MAPGCRFAQLGRPRVFNWYCVVALTYYSTARRRVAPAVGERRCLTVAVGAEKANIFRPIVQEVAADVVDVQRQWLSLPRRANPTGRALLQDPDG